ncbi:MAG: hypothetical protein ACOZCL_14600 [Bacillota bacterium]
MNKKAIKIFRGALVVLLFPIAFALCLLIGDFDLIYDVFKRA